MLAKELSRREFLKLGAKAAGNTLGAIVLTRTELPIQLLNPSVEKSKQQIEPDHGRYGKFYEPNIIDRGFREEENGVYRDFSVEYVYKASRPVQVVHHRVTSEDGGIYRGSMEIFSEPRYTLSYFNENAWNIHITGKIGRRLKIQIGYSPDRSSYPDWLILKYDYRQDVLPEN